HGPPAPQPQRQPPRQPQRQHQQTDAAITNSIVGRTLMELEEELLREKKISNLQAQINATKAAAEAQGLNSTRIHNNVIRSMEPRVTFTKTAYRPKPGATVIHNNKSKDNREYRPTKRGHRRARTSELEDRISGLGTPPANLPSTTDKGKERERPMDTSQ
ncbi:hypothetical protein P7C70_g7689, partial [Phenoliferia sp. Uapishka_3]